MPLSIILVWCNIQHKPPTVERLYIEKKQVSLKFIKKQAWSHASESWKNKNRFDEAILFILNLKYLPQATYWTEV